MRVLQIGSDRTILDADSRSAARMRAYGKKFGKLDIIVFSRRRMARSVKLSDDVDAYATNSSSRFLYVFGATYTGLKLPHPDVVSVQDPFEAGFAGLVISLIRRVPLHVQIHTDFLSPEFSKLSVINRLRVFIAGIVLRYATRIRVVSERVRRSIEPRYELHAPISILPIFVNVERFRATLPDEALVARDHLFNYKFLVVSRLEKEKNVSLAISAFAQASIEKSCLIIIGDGSELKELRKFAEKKGVGKWVFFEGYADPATYYKVVDLVLFPSLYDGYGMVIVEALAAGVPVLSTDVGIAREAGAIISPPEKFGEALKRWSKDGPRKAELKNYPYRSFVEYVQECCDDIASCASR